jgi:hypothetical protein
MSAGENEMQAGVAQSHRNCLQAWKKIVTILAEKKDFFHCYNVPHRFVSMS